MLPFIMPVITDAGEPRSRLFDFRFLEQNVLAHDWVVFSELQLCRSVTGVLLSHVVEACIGGADQLDEDRGWLCHCLNIYSRRNSGIVRAAHHTGHICGVKS